MKWELDLWYELWERAGSQGLDTWHDIRGVPWEDPSNRRSPDAGRSEMAEDGPPEGT